MKRFTAFLLLALVAITISCSTKEVSKNNSEANGDVKSSNENSNDLANLNQKEDDSKSGSNSAENTATTKAPNSPEGLVEDLYNQSDNENSPFFQDKNRALVDKYFVKSLADLIWKDSVENKDEIGVLDFDPLYNAQDVEVAEFKIGQAEIKDEKATVTVTFLNFGEEQTIKYLLTKVDGVWKIEDIDYGEDTLTKVFKENSK